MLFITLGLAALASLGCIETEFDVPPLCPQGPTLVATATVADVKEFYEIGALTEITDDLIVDAVVVADDKGGNFYKKLVLQDETGGIEVLINQRGPLPRVRERPDRVRKDQGLVHQCV